MGRNRSVRRKPTHVQGEHANSTQKGQSWDSNPKPTCEALLRSQTHTHKRAHTHTHTHTHTKPVIPATWKTPDYHLLCLRWALVGTLQADRNWNPLVQWKTMTEISHTIHLHKSHKCAIITNKFKELLINEKTIRRCFLLVKLLIYLRNWTNLQTKHFGQKKVLRTLEDFTLFVSTLKWLETWYESPP